MYSIDQAGALAEDLVLRAVRAGADAADAAVTASTATDVTVRLGKLEDVNRSENQSLSLRIFCGRRHASIAATDLGGQSADTLVDRAIAMARAAPEDEWAGLAPQDRLLHGAPPLLDLDDGEEGDPVALKERALAAEDAARSVSGITNSEGGGASVARGIIALATSHGFAGAYSQTSYGVSASVIAGSGSEMERDYAHHSARHQRLLETPEEVGQRAGERAVRRLAPGRLTSGTMPVVYDPRVAGGLIGHLIGAIAGSAIARKTSFLLDALGTAVFDIGVTIRDDPHVPHGLRSRPFDGEGLPVSPVSIVSEGMLETWLLDSASARQLGLEPTGHAARGGGVATSNLYIAAGRVSPEALIADIACGVYVTELIGMGVNGVTGDYSRGASGFLILDGQLAGPVSEFTVAGNLKDMYRGMTPANDLEMRYGINAPTLRVEGMTVAGD